MDHAGKHSSTKDLLQQILAMVRKSRVDQSSTDAEPGHQEDAGQAQDGISQARASNLAWATNRLS
jgi:hypothetical protein